MRFSVVLQRRVDPAVAGRTGLLDRRGGALEGAQPTPTRQAAGGPDSCDEGSVYHMIPTQGHVQFVFGQVIDDRDTQHGIPMPPVQCGGELAAPVRAGFGRVNHGRHARRRGHRRLDLGEAGHDAARLVGQGQRLAQVVPQGRRDPVRQVGRHGGVLGLERPQEGALAHGLGHHRPLRRDPGAAAGEPGPQVRHHRAVRPQDEADHAVRRLRLTGDDAGALGAAALALAATAGAGIEGRPLVRRRLRRVDHRGGGPNRTCADQACASAGSASAPSSVPSSASGSGRASIQPACRRAAMIRASASVRESSNPSR
ncbi:hypothetical protein MPOCJGCO_3088 [Methylobacterium trifolii]|uniref:Uncharacterized protein n=1 Tax=Methylobacterium trifolii TaxID=1003092 RepID=A0ABQ4U1E9_9HYPH|nr:hypothetical protein MPOCJGCO_3088 [Methylobacterium trifolii]